ncbi:MAG: TlpA family protein disulfide reductase [Nitrospiraceae bacterium]
MNRRKGLFTLVGAAVVATITLAACSTPAQPDTVTRPPISDREGSGGGELAPDFSITAYQGENLLGGTEVTLSELLAQGRPLVLNFWAGLCPPCRLEMPDLQAVYGEYQDRVLLFGLDVGPFIALGSQEDGQALLQELAITYPAGTTTDPEVVRAYQVLGMPTTYFITPQGEIVRTWTGLLTRDQTSELVEALLVASASS